MKKYILTGGPGVGKTKVLEVLAAQGHPVIPEVARIIISEEQQKEKDLSRYHSVLPWTDLEQFQNLVLERQIQEEATLSDLINSHHSFLDRSCVDPLAYVDIGNVPIRKDIYQLIEQADYTKAFFLHRLPAYANDEQRKENAEDAVRLQDKIYEVYDRAGFDIVEVPLFADDEQENIAKRVEFILHHTKDSPQTEIEKKYQVDHARVQKALSAYQVKDYGVDEECNRAYDIANLLTSHDCLLRIRTIGDEHMLTIKGPNQSSTVKQKFECNLIVPALVSYLAHKILPPDISYHKRRQTYNPLGDSSCTICLDYIPELGQEFVEIEAGSENQVLLWEKRLGLGEYAINKSYPALVKEKRGI